MEDLEKLRFNIRHSTAHIMAEAVMNLFPGTMIGIGPPTSDGFYYDFDCPHQITKEDFKNIESEMKKIIKSKRKFSGAIASRDEASKLFSNQPYKLEIIKSIPKDEEVTIWSHESWEDICRGDHVEHTGNIKAFKLLDVAGAYWRGDEKNKMLQRVYGTAWESKEEQKKHLDKLELASKRDHRKLGTSLDLFYFDEFSPAMPFFLPKGTFVMNQLTTYMRDKYNQYGYEEVITPQIFSSKLWDLSGHSSHFKDNMFFTENEDNKMGIKPMNCPSHYLLYRSRLHSYKDLPIRYADFGRLHRNERSGVSHGLTRVKSFSQDDSHIFCTKEQIESEILKFLEFLEEVYEDFAFKKPTYYLSLRPENRTGDDEMWDYSESIMKNILENSNMDFSVQAGEGAFYGPKIDITVPDALGREWQLGTVQLDFFASGKFGLNYINQDGEKEDVVLIHRAIFGSLERFFGILIEHFGGSFPLWLAPEQYTVIPISEDHFEDCKIIGKSLSLMGLRGKVDLSSDRFNNKIRKAQKMKIPLMLSLIHISDENSSLTIRLRNGENLNDVKIKTLEKISKTILKINDDEGIKLAFIGSEGQNE